MRNRGPWYVWKIRVLKMHTPQRRREDDLGNWCQTHLGALARSGLWGLLASWIQSGVWGNSDCSGAMSSHHGDYEGKQLWARQPVAVAEAYSGSRPGATQSCVHSVRVLTVVSIAPTAPGLGRAAEPPLPCSSWAAQGQQQQQDWQAGSSSRPSPPRCSLSAQKWAQRDQPTTTTAVLG